MAKDFHNEPGFQREQNKPVAPSIETSDPSYRPNSPGTGGSRAGAIVLSIVAIIIAIGVGIFTWVVYNDMSAVQAKLENKNAEVNELIQNAAGKVTSVTEQKQQEMQGEIVKLQEQMKTFLSENAAQLEQQKNLLKQNIDDAIKDAETRLQALLKQTASHREQWALEEVEYMVRLANLNLTLGQNYEQTLKLLKMADKNLASIKNPALDEVRQALANDITQLSTAPDVDLVGLVAKIDSISNQVQKLSVLPNKKFTKNLATDKKAPDDEATWRQHVDKTMTNLRSMFVVRKLDGPIMPLLTPAQLVYLKENIRLKLSQAEWAALHHEPALYKKNLAIAKDWLNHYKNHDLAAVKSLQAQITELEKVNVKPSRPKVLASLSQISSTLANMEMPAATVPQLKAPTAKPSTITAPASSVSPDVSEQPAEVTSAPTLRHAGVPEQKDKQNVDQAKKAQITEQTGVTASKQQSVVSPTTEQPKQTSATSTQDKSQQKSSAPTLVFENPADQAEQKTVEKPASQNTTETSPAQVAGEPSTSPAQTGAGGEGSNTASSNTENGNTGFKSPESISNTTTGTDTEKRLEQEAASSGQASRPVANTENPFVSSSPNANQGAE